jgi:hypothetical protein
VVDAHNYILYLKTKPQNSLKVYIYQIPRAQIMKMYIFVPIPFNLQNIYPVSLRKWTHALVL